MKPRTTVPAALVRDLKAHAWRTDDARLAYLLLLFDPATDAEGGRTVSRMADSLIAVSARLARGETAARKHAAQRSEEALTALAKDAAAREGMTDSSTASALDRQQRTLRCLYDGAADVMLMRDDLAALRRLQRRVWNVIDGLMLHVRGGRLPVTRLATTKGSAAR